MHEDGENRSNAVVRVDNGCVDSFSRLLHVEKIYQHEVIYILPRPHPTLDC